LELPYTELIRINDIDHYLISFNSKVAQPVTTVLSSSNTEMLSETEILNIVKNPPVEEI